jgi:hypothetical protein
MIDILHTHSVSTITTVMLGCVASGKQLDLFMEFSSQHLEVGRTMII